MPFTPAFIDTGKIVPERYDIAMLKKEEEKKRQKYSRQILSKLVKKEHVRLKKIKNQAIKTEHTNLNWNFKRLKELISDRLLARVKRPEQTMREAYKLFGVSKDGGVKKGKFRKALENMGLHLTPVEINDLFSKFDVDHSGFLDFEELVDHCMPKDYTRKTWVTKRDLEIYNSTSTRVQPDAPNFPASTAKFRWSPEQIERMIRQKLIARCKRPEEQFQTAFLLFGRPKHGITSRLFKNVCQKLGISLTMKEVEHLMDKWDDDHSGKLDFVEFCNGIMGPDYTKKTWNQVRGEKIAKELAAKRLFVDVSVIEQHEQSMQRFNQQEEHMKTTQKKKKNNNCRRKERPF